MKLLGIEGDAIN